MRTLSGWPQEFLETPYVLHCAEMRLEAYADHVGPVFAGSGQIHLDDPYSLRFVMHAAPVVEGADTARRLANSFANPFDAHHQFRLRVTDYHDREWNCGWVCPELTEHSAKQLLFRGYFDRMVTGAAPGEMSTVEGAELVFCRTPELPLTEPLRETAQIGEDRVGIRTRGGRHVLNVLGSRIEFSRQPWSRGLFVVAGTSQHLRHALLENMLSEPLRVLTGELMYPRLVARNLGMRATIEVRRTLSVATGITGFWAEFLDTDSKLFWDFFAAYLRYIVETRDSKSFESHPVTRLHEEVIQARGRSRRIQELVLSTTIEGVCHQVAAPGKMPSEYAEDTIGDLILHLKEWDEDADALDRAIKAVRHLKQPSARALMRDLVKGRVISQEQFDSWKRIRDPAAHGQVSDPWPTEENERDLESLVHALYLLTNHLVGGPYSLERLETGRRDLRDLFGEPREE